MLQSNAFPQRVYQLSAYAKSDNTSPDLSPRQMYAQSGPLDPSPTRPTKHPELLSVHDLDEDDDWAYRRGAD